LRIVVVSDEEVGSPEGAGVLRRSVGGSGQPLFFASGCAQDAIITRRKGTGNVTVVGQGKAAHAGNAHAEGKNAIWAVARWVDAAQQLTDYERGVTVNVGTISGGIGKNTVPEHAEAHADIRYLTRVDGEALVQRLREAAERAAASVPGTRLELSGGVNRDPLERTPANVALMEEYARAARASGLGTVEAGLIGGASDPSTTSGMGIASIDGLGPRGKGFHTVEEQIEVETLVPQAEALARFLAGRARGGVGWRGGAGPAPRRRRAGPPPLSPPGRPGPARRLPPRVPGRRGASPGDRPREGHRGPRTAGPRPPGPPGGRPPPRRGGRGPGRVGGDPRHASPVAWGECDPPLVSSVGVRVGRKPSMGSAAPLTVIVVDAQALFRRSIQDRLRSDGYDVVSAANGIEALELLQAAPGPCVVLLDLMMPVMNGVEFLHALDRRGEKGDVRVMLVSGHGVVDRVALDSKRVVARLQKPLEMDERRSALETQRGPSLPGPRTVH